MTYTVRTTTDIEYANVDGQSLCLDLHMPESGDELPCVVYFHGGGWMRGDRKAAVPERIHPVVSAGVAVASVSYRFTDVATYPAQLQDAKAAVRWLRANADEYGLRAESVGAWGASAGGWIALMLGFTGGRKELEGQVGDHLDEDSSVQATCAWFPVTDLLAMGPERESAGLPLPAFMEGVTMPEPSMEARLLGVDVVQDVPDHARDASPIAHAAHAGGPVLLLHGNADGMVNAQQSKRLNQELMDAGQESQLLLLDGANHESQSFHTPAVLSAVAGFFLGAL